MAKKHAHTFSQPVDPFAGARLAWVASKIFTSHGVVYNPGKLLEFEPSRDFLAQGYAEPVAILADGSTVPCPYVARRILDSSTRRYLPGALPGTGDVIPGVRKWGSFHTLLSGGWFEHVSAERLEQALREEAAAAGVAL